MSNNRPSLNPALREFWTTKARNKVLYGGRASSKSHDAAGFAIFLAQRYTLKFLCVRQFQNKIADSVYTLLKLKISAFGLDNEFHITDNCIKHKITGSEFMFYGLARNLSEIKSIEGVDILWSEESHLLTKEQWEILEPTIRKENSECWIIFNPRLITDFVWKRFVVNPPKNTIVRKINYQENPFLSKTMLDVIEDAKETDYDDYMHTYEGEPLTNDDESIIKRSWILSAIDAHVKLGIIVSGQKRIGFDIADSGEDECAIIGNHGSLVNYCEKWKAKEDELLFSCTKTWAKANETESIVFYDGIGVGAACGAKFNEINEIRSNNVKHNKFFAGGAVEFPDMFIKHTTIKNKDFYSNIKAQKWWQVAERFKNTHNAVTKGQAFKDDEMIFIDSSIDNLEQLVTELSTPRRRYDKAGRVIVESKDDLKKRGVGSPNLADAFIMSMLNYNERPKPDLSNIHQPHYGYSWQS